MYLGGLVEWSYTATVYDLNNALAPKWYDLPLSRYFIANMVLQL